MVINLLYVGTPINRYKMAAIFGSGAPYRVYPLPLTIITSHFYKYSGACVNAHIKWAPVITSNLEVTIKLRIFCGSRFFVGGSFFVNAIRFTNIYIERLFARLLEYGIL